MSDTDMDCGPTDTRTITSGEYTEWSELEPPEGDGFYLNRNGLTFLLCGLQWRKNRYDYYPENWDDILAKARTAARNQRLPFYQAAHDFRRAKPYRWERIT